MGTSIRFRLNGKPTTLDTDGEQSLSDRAASMSARRAVSMIRAGSLKNRHSAAC
jgi:hypothetical protein